MCVANIIRAGFVFLAPNDLKDGGHTHPPPRSEGACLLWGAVMGKQSHCIDCGAEIGPTSARCKSCAAKARWERGDYDGEEFRRKRSEATRAAWKRGCFRFGPSSSLIDEVGNHHGKLVVLERAGSKNGEAAWLCECDCGNKTVVRGSTLRRGEVVSCGCYQGSGKSNDVKVTKRNGVQGKACGDCGNWKPLAKFHRGAAAGGSGHRCKRCKASYMLKLKYDITLDDYEEMLEAQCNGCAICGQLPSGRRLIVDHDHETGIVRGLLCFNCNVMLGNARDDPVILEIGAAYLRRKL